MRFPSSGRAQEHQPLPGRPAAEVPLVDGQARPFAGRVNGPVDAGQPLAVLQAMKMENELSLPRAGTVISIEAEAGETVEQGQVLVIVE